MSVIGPSWSVPHGARCSQHRPGYGYPPSRAVLAITNSQILISAADSPPLVVRALPLALLLARGGKLDCPLPALVAGLSVPGLVSGARPCGDHDRRRLLSGSARRRAGRLCGNSRDTLLTRRLAWQHRGELGLHAALPGFRRTPGDRFHVVLRFIRKFALFIEPVLDAPRPGIVGGSSKSEISKPAHKVAEQSCGRRNRLDRIERIVEPDGRRRLRHKLRNALRAGRTHNIRLETTFLEKKPNEERHRQSVRMRRLCHAGADLMVRAGHHAIFSRRRAPDRHRHVSCDWRRRAFDLIRRFMDWRL